MIEAICQGSLPADHAIRTDREHRQFRAVAQLLPQPHRLFHGIFVVLVHAPGQVGLVEPEALGVRLEAGFQVRDLFDADQ